MINVKHLIHKYNENTILNDVSFNQEQGTVTAIIGPSGSGKTTLLRTLNALALPESGTITIGNETFNTSKHTKKDIAKLRQKSAMVFQNYNLFKNKTILENITVGLIHGKNHSTIQAKEIALSYLERVNLASQKDKYPIQLSGGQSQRIGIIRALALNPDVLLLDEPTSALDPESIQGVLSLIKSIAQEGMTMVLVTHEIEFAKAIADQMIFIDDGQIIHHGTPQEVLDHNNSERINRFLNKVSTERDKQ
ncbi:amino acid ABC transporter ATP-binding protein [Staphylococcus pseudoxylosus]|uniref:amino acid ABC transporter ATP-binding protein n=1 Tax=Staphylococcus pseudoxylosus TaxID=2282419 RepID=UPI000D1D4529|nr:amino acid ABC transporter ATP-binding protein [Staphylococcus pseudoxylosus]PTI45091.1 amino acid ABC transporter ATP-binding protein [Staphylococcus xylosus]MDW8798086.1 amino acid ABC transporter ATP-binding protein [Staphylococcus pseudoxylosus]MEB6037688.1 amino acid ABC transporter ATP-binding protein [Staphylococcus pseudoxylosus]MEB6046166.1 amino acid ABC transporter ATP-binding protein [Staphylococcus pseudoxylosus]MEB6060808.1 amino acid ABC transporter ATP-binding protein [Staph